MLFSRLDLKKLKNVFCFSHAVVNFKCQKVRVYVPSQFSVESTTANISLFIKSTCFAPRFELLEKWAAAWNTLQTGARH
jgi:hypothetical protein